MVGRPQVEAIEAVREAPVRPTSPVVLYAPTWRGHVEETSLSSLAVGEEVVRVWRLYLVGGALAFRDGRMGVDQILMVKPGAAHTLPPVRTW